MTESRTTWTQIAAATLGVIGLGAVGYGLFLVALGATAGDLLGTSLGGTAAVVVVIIGVLAVVVGVISAIAAIGVWQARAAATVVGLVVGAVVILGPVVARVSGGWHDALWVSIALGVILVGSLLLERRGAPDRS
jgi:hypothetical protein